MMYTGKDKVNILQISETTMMYF